MDFNSCLKQVEEFNRLGGNFEDLSQAKLLSQVIVNKEEANELFTAVNESEGNEQILKETVDNLVTLFGVVSMLQKRGYNVIGAWDKVNKNNMTKFCDDSIQAEYSKLWYSNDNINISYHQDTQTGKFVLKDQNGKIRKKIGYEKCSVSEFTPNWSL